VPKRRREHIVNASIKRSYLWKHFQVFKLTQNMRLSCMVDNQNKREKMKEFVKWILNIVDGKTISDDGYEMIQIPDDLLLHKGNDTKEIIVQSTYPDNTLGTNDKVYEMIQILDNMYPMEFLNTLKFLGIPDHELKLKIGLPVILLRNINQGVGLCIGTRMTITQLGQKFIEAQIITRTNLGDKVFIPRSIMRPNDAKWPF
jgi:hypothetical protein